MNEETSPDQPRQTPTPPYSDSPHLAQQPGWQSAGVPAASNYQGYGAQVAQPGYYGTAPQRQPPAVSGMYVAAAVINWVVLGLFIVAT
jgi:hypothetical protein